MMARLAQAMAQRTRRERGLLASLVFLVLPLTLVFIVALPLIEQRDRARSAQAEARALYLWVQERDAEWQAKGPEANGLAADTSFRPEPVGIAGVEAALGRAGLAEAVRTLEDANDRKITLRLEGARFGDVARFLEWAGPDLGYRIARYRLTAEAAPGLIAAELELQP